MNYLHFCVTAPVLTSSQNKEKTPTFSIYRFQGRIVTGWTDTRMSCPTLLARLECRTSSFPKERCWRDVLTIIKFVFLLWFSKTFPFALKKKKKNLLWLHILLDPLTKRNWDDNWELIKMSGKATIYSAYNWMESYLVHLTEKNSLVPI